MADPLYFLCRLLPPRPNFMQTMTADERVIMQRHVAYWSAKVATGNALVFGPVADPRGGYGIGIIRVDSKDQIMALRDADPAMLANVGFAYDVLAMPRIVFAGQPAG